MRRASWCGRSGPIRSIWRNGGGRTASPPRPARSISSRAACGASSCTAGRPRLREPHHLRRDRAAGAAALPPRRRRRCRAGAVSHHGDVRATRRQDARHLARRVPVGRGARPRHQGIRRRQGPGADLGAARRICGRTEGLRSPMSRHADVTARRLHFITHKERVPCRCNPTVLRRPLRRGDRVLQEGDRRQDRDDDALEGVPGQERGARRRTRTR